MSASTPPWGEPQQPTRPDDNSWWSDTSDGSPSFDDPPTRVWLSPSQGLVIRHDEQASPLPVHWIDEHFLPPADAVEMHPCGHLPAWDDHEDRAHTGEPVHRWFSLSHSSYLVLPRVLMQSMPVRWQKAMVALLSEADEAFDHLEHPEYKVDTVDWTEPGDLSRTQRDALGITVDYGDEDAPDVETTYYDRDGRELDEHRACVPVPVPDRWPGYRHGRVEPRYPSEDTS